MIAIAPMRHSKILWTQQKQQKTTRIRPCIVLILCCVPCPISRIYISIVDMSVQVAVRVRPFNEREIFINSNCCVEMEDNKTRLLQQSSTKEFQKRQFTFDYSFWSHDQFQKLENGLLVPMTKKYWDQQKVFNQIGNKILNDAWEGYNCCLFAYGQTGSGKSYSMLGYGLNKGIVPRVCEQMFRRMCENEQPNKLYSVTISMIEIYNQKVQDLLIPSSKRPLGGLQIRQNKKMGVYVQGITKHNVNSYKAIERWMEEGSKNRSLASTLMNQYSSRAHTIISIEFVQRQEVGKNQVTQKNSIIHLIDLAGSQRVSKTGLSNSDRLKEAGNINKSLHHLGLVIQILADKSIGKRKNQVVPYRSSCLTRILQNSLGGNSKTIMICALSPAFDNYEETLSTLRYADQVKKIKNCATVNQSMTDKLIRELREENERLRLMIKELNDRTTISPQDESVLRDAKHYQKQLMRMIGKNQQAMKSFAQGDQQENLLSDDISYVDLEKLQEESESQQLSILDCFKSNEPYITNLNEDQMLNGKVRYNIQNQLLIGRKNGNPTPQVMLGALGIEPNHAKIYKKDGKIYINSVSEVAGDFTYLNGDNVYEPMELYHNDRIIFGTSCVFIVKIPNNLEPRPGTVREQQINYQMAISELQSVQKNRSMANDQEFISKLQAIEEEVELEKQRMQQKLKEEKAKYQEEIQRMAKQKERQQQILMKQLQKQELQKANLLRQREEMEEQKRRTKELEELLEKERSVNQQLERAVQHSTKAENDLRQSLQIQQAQMEIERLKKQKQLIEEGLRKKQEQERTQKQRLQQQIEKIHQISRQKAEQEANFTQEILKQNLIMAQNENILNERFLELKKKKKKIQELRNLLIKKERVELQKRLVEVVPMIVQLILIARQMRREIQANVKIEYQFFGYYELTQCLKTSSYKSKLKLRVLIDNNEEGRSYIWSIDQFKNRLDLAKDMLEKYVQDPRNPVLFDKQKDPFWDPCESELIGEAYLGLEHLLFQLDYYNPSLKIIGGQRIQGEMAVRLYPTSASGSENLAHEEERERQIFQSRVLLEKDLHFILAIDHLVIPDDFFDVKVQYQILEDNYKMVKYETQKVPFAKQIHYLRKHTFKDITEDTLLYMGDSHISFKVYGFRKIREVVKTRDIVSEFQQEEVSQAISPPRSAKIIQNTDYLQKLQRQFEQQAKQNQKLRKQNLKQAEKKGSGSKEGKKSSGKKDKKEECLLF